MTNWLLKLLPPPPLRSNPQLKGRLVQSPLHNPAERQAVELWKAEGALCTNPHCENNLSIQLREWTPPISHDLASSVLPRWEGCLAAAAAAAAFSSRAAALALGVGSFFVPPSPAKSFFVAPSPAGREENINSHLGHAEKEGQSLESGCIRAGVPSLRSAVV